MEMNIVKIRYYLVLLISFLMFSSNVLALACYSKFDNDKTNFSRCLDKSKRGDASAQYLLGFMYVNGDGVRKDYKKAVKWFTNAADQGHARAQNNLGYRYSKGLGVEKDYKKAVKWFTKAA